MPFGIFLRQPTAAATVAAAKAITPAWAEAAPAKKAAAKDAVNFYCVGPFVLSSASCQSCRTGTTGEFRACFLKASNNYTKCPDDRVFGKGWGGESDTICFECCTDKCYQACKAAKKALEKTPQKEFGKRHVEIEKVNEGANTWGSFVDFRVVRQSHVGENFCHEGKYFRASDGYELRSAAGPGKYADNNVYLRGTNHAYDNNTVRVSTSEFAQVEQAVHEYNKLYFDSLTPAPVKKEVAKKAPTKKAPAKKEEAKKEAPAAEEKWVPKEGDLVKCLSSANGKYTTTCGSWKGIVKEVTSNTLGFIQGRDGSQTLDKKGFRVEFKHFTIDKEAMEKAKANPQTSPINLYVKRTGNSSRVGTVLPVQKRTSIGYRVIEVDGSTSFWGEDYCEEVPCPIPKKKELSEKEKTHVVNGGEWVPKVGDLVESRSYGYIGRVRSLGRDNLTLKRVDAKNWYKGEGETVYKAPYCFDLVERP